MSFNPTEMLQKIRLQTQIQNNSQSQSKFPSSLQQTSTAFDQNNHQNSYNGFQLATRDPNIIPANPNSVFYLNKQNQKGNMDQRQYEDKQNNSRNSLRNQSIQQASENEQRGKVHIHISSDMIDNERNQVQEYLHKVKASNPSTRFDSELIENLVLKIQKLEGRVMNLTTNLNDANSSVSDLFLKKQELENEVNEHKVESYFQRNIQPTKKQKLNKQIAQQIEQRDERQPQNNNIQPNKVATFGNRNEARKGDYQMSNTSALTQKEKKHSEIANKSGIQFHDDFQMHAISEQMSEDDDDQKSRLSYAKQSQILKDSAKILDEEIVQLRLSHTAKMESISDILKRKGKSPLKVQEQLDQTIKEEVTQKSFYQKTQNQSQMEEQNRKSLQERISSNQNQQSFKENNNTSFKGRDSDFSKSPLTQSQILNKSQKAASRASYTPNPNNEENNLLNSQKSSHQIKESRLNTSTTPTRQIEKSIGRLNLDLLANLVKANPCLNRPILTIKMDENLFN